MKPRHTGVWLSVPATFRPENYPEQLQGLYDEARWLVHKVITLTQQRKHGVFADRGGYQNISHQTMEQMMQPKAVKVVRPFLLEHGVLECNNFYRKGKHSKGYRIGKKYKSANITRVECGRPVMAAKILEQTTIVHSLPVRPDQLAAYHQHLRSWLLQARIDVDGAYATIEALSAPKSLRSSGKAARRDARKTLTHFSGEINRLTVTQIAAKEFDFNVCTFGNRVHSPITRLQTEARAYLYFQGYGPLVSIDIKNSQLLFFALLLIQHRLSSFTATQPSASFKSIVLRGMGDGEDGNGELEKETGERPPDLKSIVLRGMGGTGVEGGEIGVRKERASESFEKLWYLSEQERSFVRMVLNGSIYEYLMKLHNEDAPVMEQIIDRGEFKRVYFRDCFFCDPSEPYVKKSRTRAIMLKHYPTVMEYIDQIKATNYKALAEAMQKRESQFMIECVVGRLMEHHPDIPVLSIHDAMLVPEEYALVVERVIRSEFDRLGVEPALHVTGHKRAA